MKNKVIMKYGLLIAIVCLFSLSSCLRDEWEKHYEADSSIIDAKMWDAIQDSAKYSKFVEFIKDSGYDTLLERDQSFTLFIPTNDAFDDFQSVGEELVQIMAYHISPTVLVAGQVGKSRRLQTFDKKFALITNTNHGMYFDTIPISNNSGLFKDGTYYEMAAVAKPRPNIMEYMKINSPVLYNYIKKRKVVLLDKNESIPLSFNSEGKTVYDSVYVEYNFFDLLYFSNTEFDKELIPKRFEDFEVWVEQNPSLLFLLEEPNFSVEEEYRDKNKTFLTFTQDQYLNALEVMSDKLGDQFTDYRSIPKDWQDDVLIPYLFESGVFDSSLTYDRFLGDVLKNSQGDSVYFDHEEINPASRFICSNGVTYQYNNFQIPDSLYNDTIWMQGEDLMEYVNKEWRFIEGVKVSDNTQEALVEDQNSAMEEQVLTVELGRNPKDEYWISFVLPKVFPRSYYFRYGASNRPSGIIDLYVNGKYIASQDNYDYGLGKIKSAEGDNIPIGRTVNWNSWVVDHITQYGDVEVKLVYTAKGKWGSNNGINIDYVALVPISQ